jgi:hypothetical protein
MTHRDARFRHGPRSIDAAIGRVQAYLDELAVKSLTSVQVPRIQGLPHNIRGSDLPVVKPNKFELVVKIKAAKALAKLLKSCWPPPIR